MTLTSLVGCLLAESILKGGLDDSERRWGGEDKRNGSFFGRRREKENNGRVGEGKVCARFCFGFSARHVSEGSGLVDTWDFRQTRVL